MYQSWVHEVKELLNIKHGLQQSAVDSAIDWQRVLAPAYGPKEDILSSDNMLIKWSAIATVKQCSKFVECVFFKSANHSQSYHENLAQLCHQELVEQLKTF